MVRKSGNLRGNSIMVEKAYEYLQKVGAKSTREIQENVNFYRKADGTKSKHSWSIHQYAQTLRTHPLFKCVGEERVSGTYGRTTNIKKYDIVPLEVVVERIMSAKHNLIRRDNLIPMLRKAIEEKEKEMEIC
tara:strand:- start:269 stop:664 length:396 start_codon:yes stop_codon:yes gene_type:complete